MSVIKNTFNTTLSSTTLQTYTITGLTASGSTTNITYMCPEASLYYLRSIYQTLIDAGYTDVSKDESEYSITLFGFKFYTLVKSSASSWKYAYPMIFVYGNEYYFHGTSQIYALNESASTTLSFNIRIVGDSQNITYITQGSYNYPNDIQSLLFLAKSKNLLTSEDAFVYGEPYLFDSKSTYYRNKKDLYVYYTSDSEKSYEFNGFHSYDLEENTNGLCSITNYGRSTAIIPVVACNGSFLIHGVVRSHYYTNKPFARGTYLKINGEIYYIISSVRAGLENTDCNVVIKAS